MELSYSWLCTGIFLCRKWWIEPGFIASQTSHLYDSFAMWLWTFRIDFHLSSVFLWFYFSHQIPLYWQRCANKTNRHNWHKCQNGVQQCTLCYHLHHYKSNKCNKETQKGIFKFNNLIYCFFILRFYLSKIKSRA